MSEQVQAASNKATASLVLALIALVSAWLFVGVGRDLEDTLNRRFGLPEYPGMARVGWFATCGASVLSVALAFLGLREVRRSRGRLWGGAAAVWAIGIAVFAVLFYMFVTSVMLVSTAPVRMRVTNDLKQLSLALFTYHDAHGTFPPAATYSPDGTPLLSWRVLVLPYLEEEELYRQFKLDEPWDSPNNLPLLEKMPRVFSHPKRRSTSDTHYLVVVGKGTAFEGTQGLRGEDFRDERSGTFLVVEAAEPVSWTRPKDLPYEAGQPLPAFGDLFVNGFHAALADSSVRIIQHEVATEANLRAAITRDGGEPTPNW